MCRFLMSLKTISTSIPRTVRMALSVLIAGFDEVKQLVHPIEVVRYDVPQRVPEHPFLHRVADPTVRFRMDDRRVDDDRHIRIRPAKVHEGPPSAGIGPIGGGAVRLALAKPLGQIDQLL